MSIVTGYLADREVEFTAYDHPRAYTSIEEARALGIHADEVVKVVVLNTAGGHALAVVPAATRLDMHLVRDATDDDVSLATEDDIRRDFDGYELGAIPPLGSLLGGITVYVDPSIVDHDSVVFASGKQTESVRMHTGDLLGDEHVKIAALRAEPATASA